MTTTEQRPTQCPTCAEPLEYHALPAPAFMQCSSAFCGWTRPATVEEVAANIPASAQAETGAVYWTKGTEIRNADGIYQWPPPMMVRDGEEVRTYPSVTTVLGHTDSQGFTRAKEWFAADEVANTAGELLMAISAISGEAQAIIRGETDKKFTSKTEVAEFVGVAFARIFEGAQLAAWDVATSSMVDRPAASLLTDKKWLSGGGSRGMTRAANRGQVTHDAMEEWVYATVDSHAERLESRQPDLIDWVHSTIASHDYALRAEDCLPYVVAMLRWLEENIETPYMAEAPLFNNAFGYAGTGDMMSTLKGREGLWFLDGKTSSTMTPRIGHWAQLAAYKHAEFYGIRNTRELLPMPAVDRVGNIYVFPDERASAVAGTCRAELREWTEGVDSWGWPYFCNLLTVFRQGGALEAICTDCSKILPAFKIAPVKEFTVRAKAPKAKKETVTV
jgi:hypothetical protein